jgi:hypothetical protein
MRILSLDNGWVNPSGETVCVLTVRRWLKNGISWSGEESAAMGEASEMVINCCRYGSEVGVIVGETRVIWVRNGPIDCRLSGSFGLPGRRIETLGRPASRYHRGMAVVRISRSEAASDFEGLVARAASGDEILIEADAGVIVKLLPADMPRPRLLSESLKILKERGSAVTLDGAFGADLEEVIRSHPEPLNPPAWD